MKRQDLDEDEDDYLDVLSSLIEEYERDAYAIKSTTGPGMIKFLIDTRGETQAKVARATGIPESSLSDMISGKRSIAARHLSILGKYFHIDPAVFLKRD